MRIIGNNPAADNAEITAVASGTLPSGKTVIVNANGTVSVVAETPVSQGTGTPALFENADSTNISVTFDSNANKVVVTYRDQGNSGYGTAVVGTVSGTNISFGTPVVFNSDGVTLTSAVFDTASNKVVIAYKLQSGGIGTAIVGTVSGTGISFGSSAVFENAASLFIQATFDSNSNKVVIAYNDDANSNYGTAIVGTVSSTSISFGSAVIFKTARCDSIGIGFDSASNKIVITYQDWGNSYYGTAIVGTVSGTGISFGTATVFEAATTSYTSPTFDSSTGKVVIAYRDGGNSNYGTAIVGTVSGTGISFGTAVVFEAANSFWHVATFDSNANKVVIAYRDEVNSSYGTVIAGTVSGTSITFDSPSVFEAAAVEQTVVTFDSSASKVVVAYSDAGNSNRGTAATFTPSSTSTNLTAENFIGFAGGAVDVDSQTEEIGSSVVFNNTGNTTKPHLCFDTNSNKVVIGFVDNTVSEKGTAIVGTVSGTSISFGSETVYETSVTDFPAMVYDSSNNKVIVAYQDEGNTDYGTVAVGTVSGTSISFGTPVVFESAAVQHVALAFDSNSNKVVVSYSDHGNSEYGTAIVGTVSGTSISFGSAAVFESAQTARVSSTFDSSNNKVVIAYRTTTGKAVVATVSGTSISFGTPVEFYNALTDELDITFDSNAGKVVIGYQSSGSDAGLAKVGTVSGTSISFGAEATFESANVASISPVFDNTINKVVLAYSDVGNSRYGTYAVGTISGTDITFGTPSVFASVDTRSQVGAVFDTTSNKVVLAYRDDSNSSYGTSVVMVPGYQEITRAEVASGSNAVIDIGSAISTNQLSLTAGQQYFVQTDGTLGLTAGSPSVIAGTAVSATDIIVKG